MSSNKPVPRITETSRPFWEALREQRVRIQQCDECQAWVFYPRRHCSNCLSPQLSWRDISGTASLYTYTIARLPTLPELSDEMPQYLAVAQFDEGPRINTTLVGLSEDDIEIGMRLRPVFDAIDERGTTLLRFTGIDTVPATTAPPPAGSHSAPTAPRRQIRADDLDALRTLISDTFSDWSDELLIDQALIDRFAELSGDDYWIHTDPERARSDGPFGTTIAHGALIQILQSKLHVPLAFDVIGFTNMVNYGSDRLRFPSAVPVGSRIHARARVKAVSKVKSGTQLTLEVNTHVVGSDQPAAVNDLLIVYM